MYINFHILIFVSFINCILKGSKCATITIYTVIVVLLMVGHRHRDLLMLRLVIFAANLHPVCQPACHVKLRWYHSKNALQCVCHEPYVSSVSACMWCKIAVKMHHIVCITAILHCIQADTLDVNLQQKSQVQMNSTPPPLKWGWGLINITFLSRSVYFIQFLAKHFFGEINPPPYFKDGWWVGKHDFIVLISIFHSIHKNEWL